MQYGEASYDESDRNRAVALFMEQGIALYLCKDIFDKGKLIEVRYTTFKQGGERAS